MTTATLTSHHNPFGMVMPSRNWLAGSGDGYRFGFNGNESVNQIIGNGITFDFGARIYDSRLGRWYCIDPLFMKYSSYSPYAFSLNCPTFLIDYDGRDVGVTITGNKMILSSTIYLSGYGADISKIQYDEAYKNWADAGMNKGTFTDVDGKVWEIEIQMVFEVAADEAIVEKVKNAGPGNAAENVMIFKGNIRSQAQYIDGMKIGNEKYRGNRVVHLNDYADGWEAMHEVLHLYGLIDRYSIVNGESKSHKGYSDNAMGATDQKLENMKLNETQFTNLGRAILNAQSKLEDECGKTPSSFVFSENTTDVEPLDSSIEDNTSQEK